MNYYVLAATITLVVVTFVGFMEAMTDTIHFFKVWRKTSPDAEMLSHGEHPGDEPIFRKSRKIQNDRMMGRGLLAFFFAIILMKSIEYLLYILTM